MELECLPKSDFGKTVDNPTTLLSNVTLDLLEALSIHPPDKDKDKTLTPSIKVPESGAVMSNVTDLPFTTESLIQETDYAFQAVGLALGDTKASTAGWSTPANHPNLVVPTKDTARGVLRTRASASPQSMFPVSPSRFVSKSKRKPDFHRKRFRHHSKPVNKSEFKTLHGAARWANVTSSILSRRLFRSDVDEMLPRSKLRQLGQETTSAPPFRPERIDSLPIEDVDPYDANCNWTPNPPSSHYSPPPAIPPRSTARAPPIDLEASLATPTGFTFSRLPFTSTKPLSIIDEVSPLSPPTPHFSPVYQAAEAARYIFLTSTPFTLTAPRFRHGLVRIERRDTSAASESLDWAAFQVAIAGTMNEGNDIERAGAEEEVDELAEWWEGFGIGLGEMQTQKMEKPKAAKRAEDGEIVQRSPLSPESPLSPMGDLTATVAEGKSIVPMGYNLYHDLGDFLEWEARHVRILYVKNIE